jgi:hypothetical protein
MRDKITRDTAWVEREYGTEKWPAVERAVRSIDGPLPTVLNRLIRAELHAEDVHAVRDVVVAGERTTLPAMAAVATAGWVAHAVASEARDADAVIELGAGWGRQLFGARLAGAAADALYVAAEFTQAGRDASELLAKRDPEMRFRAAAFDYHHPHLELPPLDRAVVFTAHSIEQIPMLPEVFVSFVLQLAREVKVLHFEPVGWQVRGGADDYAETHDYNRNLVPLLRRAEADGVISITGMAVDAFGLNPQNPTTLVTWTGPAGSGDRLE